LVNVKPEINPPSSLTGLHEKAPIGLLLSVLKFGFDATIGGIFETLATGVCSDHFSS